MDKKLFSFNTKTLVATGLGAALFTLLFMFVKVPTGIPETAPLPVHNSLPYRSIPNIYGGHTMTRNEAWNALTAYNHEPFHLQHALTVELVMRTLAQRLGYADEADFWAMVGLLHDIDFERFPDEHCKRAPALLRVGLRYVV